MTGHVKKSGNKAPPARRWAGGAGVAWASGDQEIGLGAHRPFAVRVFGLQDLVADLQVMGVVGGAVAADGPVVDGLGRGEALGPVADQALEGGQAVVEAAVVEIGLALAQEQVGDELLRGQEAHHALVGVAVGVADEERRGPAHPEVAGDGLGVRALLHRHEFLIDDLPHLGAGVRDRTHLFAADSGGQEEIQENGLVLGLGPVLGRLPVLQPGYSG